MSFLRLASLAVEMNASFTSCASQTSALNCICPVVGGGKASRWLHPPNSLDRPRSSTERKPGFEGGALFLFRSLYKHVSALPKRIATNGNWAPMLASRSTRWRGRERWPGDMHDPSSQRRARALNTATLLRSMCESLVWNMILHAWPQSIIMSWGRDKRASARKKRWERACNYPNLGSRTCFGRWN